MIEHKFMFCTLELFGFGENLINLVKLIYKDTNRIFWQNQNFPQLFVNVSTNITLSNTVIRNVFVNELYPFSSNKNVIFQYFSKDEVKILRTKYLKFPVAPKAKEVHFMDKSIFYIMEYILLENSWDVDLFLMLTTLPFVMIRLKLRTYFLWL